MEDGAVDVGLDEEWKAKLYGTVCNHWLVCGRGHRRRRRPSFLFWIIERQCRLKVRASGTIDTRAGRFTRGWARMIRRRSGRSRMKEQRWSDADGFIVRWGFASGHWFVVRWFVPTGVLAGMPEIPVLDRDGDDVNAGRSSARYVLNFIQLD